MYSKKLKIKFALKFRHQDIIIGERVINDLSNFLNSERYSKVLFFIDRKVYNLFSRQVNQIFKQIKIPKAKIQITVKRDKSVIELFQVLKICTIHNLDRNSCLIGIGGGRIGDLVGLSAALYMRGIDFIQIGTTCMSQVDCIVGKTAINYFGRKNLIGNFYSPVLTICDTAFLKTNNEYLIRDGFVEIIKHAFIKPRIFLKKLEQKILSGVNLKKLVSGDIIYNSLFIKTQCIVNDFYDKNNQHLLLSYGHTIANAIEELCGYKIRHGEAVALGMLICAEYARLIRFLKTSDYIRHNRLIRKVMDVRAPNNISSEKIFGILKRDKNLFSTIPRMIILKKFGQGVLININPRILDRCFKNLLNS